MPVPEMICPTIIVDHQGGASLGAMTAARALQVANVECLPSMYDTIDAADCVLVVRLNSDALANRAIAYCHSGRRGVTCLQRRTAYESYRPYHVIDSLCGEGMQAQARAIREFVTHYRPTVLYVTGQDYHSPHVSEEEYADLLCQLFVAALC